MKASLDHSLTIIYNLDFFSKGINPLFHYEIGHESSLQDSELQKRHDMLYIIWIMHRFIIITRRGLYTGLIRDSKRRKLLNENSVPHIIQSSSTVPLYSSLLTHKKVARYLLIQLNSSYVGVVLVGIYIYLSEIRAW
jgi:hypothetical protein